MHHWLLLILSFATSHFTHPKLSPEVSNNNKKSVASINFMFAVLHLSNPRYLSKIAGVSLGQKETKTIIYSN